MSSDLDFDWTPIIAGFFAIIIVILLAFGLFFLVNVISMAVQPNVEVFVNKELIYKGTNACVDVISSGDTTTVNTSKFCCMMPDKTYTSKDVVVRTVD